MHAPQLSINGVEICIPEQEEQWNIPAPRVRQPPIRRQNRKPKSWYQHKFSQQSYDELLQKQNGGCAICGRKPHRVYVNGTPRKRLPLDHDHITGKVRGLLCRQCNVGLGCFGDKAELLEAALKYLQR